MVIFMSIRNFQLPHLFCWIAIYVILLDVLSHKYDYNILI